MLFQSVAMSFQPVGQQTFELVHSNSRILSGYFKQHQKQRKLICRCRYILRLGNPSDLNNILTMCGCESKTLSSGPFVFVPDLRAGPRDEWFGTFSFQVETWHKKIPWQKFQKKKHILGCSPWKIKDSISDVIQQCLMDIFPKVLYSIVASFIGCKLKIIWKGMEKEGKVHTPCIALVPKHATLTLCNKSTFTFSQGNITRWKSDMKKDKIPAEFVLQKGNSCELEYCVPWGQCVQWDASPNRDLPAYGNFGYPNNWKFFEPSFQLICDLE